MPFTFKKILVPVDFTINTELAINKAVELADRYASKIYLLHIVLPEKKSDNSLPGALEKMQQWKSSIEDAMSFIAVEIIFENNGPIRKTIELIAARFDVDLVVIGKHSPRNWHPFFKHLAPGMLAENSGRAVLTVRPGSMRNQIKTVLVPVVNKISSHKTNTIAALINKPGMRIHLVTFVKDRQHTEDFSVSSLLKLYQWLKNNFHCQVDYAVLPNYNKARSLLDYAKKIDADVLLVNERSETKMGWMNNHIADMLPPESRVQVLSV
jgi:nucleotide-binding universal stress UspA family protein